MGETIFEQTYHLSSRIAAAQATKIAVRYSLPKDQIEDLTQEALLELWRKAPAFDERRAGWRTYAERVVANKLASLLRHMHTSRSGHGRVDPLEGLQLADPAPYADTELQIDVWRVLKSISSFDRTVALVRIDCGKAAETSRRLGVGRATIYRSIDRLDTAFTDAGMAPSGRSPKRNPAKRPEARV